MMNLCFLFLETNVSLVQGRTCTYMGRFHFLDLLHKHCKDTHSTKIGVDGDIVGSFTNESRSDVEHLQLQP